MHPEVTRAGRKNASKHSNVSLFFLCFRNKPPKQELSKCIYTIKESLSWCRFSCLVVLFMCDQIKNLISFYFFFELVVTFWQHLSSLSTLPRFSLTGSGSVTVESVQRHSSGLHGNSDDGPTDFSLTAIDLPAMRLHLSGVIASNKERWKELSVHGKCTVKQKLTFSMSGNIQSNTSHHQKMSLSELLLKFWY